MINLVNKCVLVRTQEEYESVLKEARRQGYRWYGGREAYPFENQCLPDILKFYSNKYVVRNASIGPAYELIEVSDIIADRNELEEAISLVRTFVKCPDRIALTDTFIRSLKLLVNTVESQLEEVK